MSDAQGGPASPERLLARLKIRAARPDWRGGPVDGVSEQADWALAAAWMDGAMTGASPMPAPAPVDSREQRLLDALKALAANVEKSICDHMTWHDLDHGYKKCFDCGRIWKGKNGHPGPDSPKPLELLAAQGLICECEVAALAETTRSEAPPDAQPLNPLAVAIIAAELAALSVRVSMLERGAAPEDGRG